VDRAKITAPVVSRMVSEQFPQWGHLPVRPVAVNGWDNTTFRLGSGLSVRLPSADAYVAQVEKEHRWLPILAPQLPLAIPEPVAKGVPSDFFPRPWSVYRWLEGEPAIDGRVADLPSFAQDLAGFLVALQRVVAADGPVAGGHNFFRGGPLAIYDGETREAIAALADDIDAAAADEVWRAALATTWERQPVWIHGDVAPGNLLVSGDHLLAVIDFGCCGVGDPACDLTIAWTLFFGESRTAFRQAIALDAGTWARARGWALWKALITLNDARKREEDNADAANPFGWRTSARQVIEAVLADHGPRT
jgi:aminoglycoside phosphotransferase (APT) family kinase protein